MDMTQLSIISVYQSNNTRGGVCINPLTAHFLAKLFAENYNPCQRCDDQKMLSFLKVLQSFQNLHMHHPKLFMTLKALI